MLWDGSPSASPQPYDPAFVGEYLTSLGTVAPDYRDWGLLPGSPVVDQGWYSESMVFENGMTRFLPGTICPELESFDWDGEGYGNPRVVGEQIDIGCDELHMLIMAGSDANDSTAHDDNQLPKSHLHPSAVAGLPARRPRTPPPTRDFPRQTESSGACAGNPRDAGAAIVAGSSIRRRPDRA